MTEPALPGYRLRPVVPAGERPRWIGTRERDGAQVLVALRPRSDAPSGGRAAGPDAAGAGPTAGLCAGAAWYRKLVGTELPGVLPLVELVEQPAGDALVYLDPPRHRLPDLFEARGELEPGEVLGVLVRAGEILRTLVRAGIPAPVLIPAALGIRPDGSIVLCDLGIEDPPAGADPQEGDGDAPRADEAGVAELLALARMVRSGDDAFGESPPSLDTLDVLGSLDGRLSEVLATLEQAQDLGGRLSLADVTSSLDAVGTPELLRLPSSWAHEDSDELIRRMRALAAASQVPADGPGRWRRASFRIRPRTGAAQPVPTRHTRQSSPSDPPTGGRRTDRPSPAETSSAAPRTGGPVTDADAGAGAGALFGSETAYAEEAPPPSGRSAPGSGELGSGSAALESGSAATGSEPGGFGARPASAERTMDGGSRRPLHPRVAERAYARQPRSRVAGFAPWRQSRPGAAVTGGAARARHADAAQVRLRDRAALAWEWLAASPVHYLPVMGLLLLGTALAVLAFGPRQPDTTLAVPAPAVVTSATATPTSAPEPEPRPGDRRSGDSAPSDPLTDLTGPLTHPRAVAQALADLRARAWTDLDVDLLRRLNAPGSPALSQDSDALSTADDDQLRYEGLTFVVREASASPRKGAQESVVLHTVVDTSAFRINRADGRGTTTPARKGAEIDLVLAWSGERWQVSDVG